jgi:hypothetical protein
MQSWGGLWLLRQDLHLSRLNLLVEKGLCKATGGGGIGKSVEDLGSGQRKRPRPAIIPLEP